MKKDLHSHYSDAELQVRHDQSVHDYPYIDLSSHEYVIINVERSVWGVIRIWAIVMAIFIVTAIAMVFMTLMASSNQILNIILIGAGLIICSLLIGGMSVRTFHRNQFVVTNERVYMHIQTTPFSYRVQNIEIENVEDFSYSQTGFLENMLGYGSLRLSTIGDEHSYPFNFVANPEEQFKVINEVVQAVDPDRPTRYRPKNQ